MHTLRNHHPHDQQNKAVSKNEKEHRHQTRMKMRWLCCTPVLPTRESRLVSAAAADANRANSTFFLQLPICVFKYLCEWLDGDDVLQLVRCRCRDISARIWKRLHVQYDNRSLCCVFFSKLFTHFPGGLMGGLVFKNHSSGKQDN